MLTFIFIRKLSKISLLILTVIIAQTSIAQNDTIENTYNSLRISFKIEGVNSSTNITSSDHNRSYGPTQLTVPGFNVGLFYKGFGISYTPSFVSRARDYYTDYYSEYQGFELFLYFKKWGIDIYSQNFMGFLIGDPDFEHYRPDWVLSEDGFHWDQDMKSTNHSINFYVKIFGKYRLGDYFFKPAYTRKSKLGVFGILSMDKRSILNTEGIFIPEAEPDFTEIYNFFDFHQYKLDIGVGGTATLFLRKLYLSTALAGGYGISSVSNKTGAGNFDELNFRFNILNMKIFTGFQGKYFRLELGAVIDNDGGRIDQTYKIQYNSSYAFMNVVFQIPLRTENKKN